MLIPLIVIGLLTGILGAFVAKMHAVTLWAGKWIAPPGTQTFDECGYRDAITTRWHRRGLICWWIGIILVFVSGTWIQWYLGAVALAGVRFVSVMVSNLTPRRAAPYLRLIVQDLAQREADYLRDNDQIRSEAAKDLKERCIILWTKTLQDLSVAPNMTEAKKTPVGAGGIEAEITDDWAQEVSSG